ncbi:MAG: TlpA family protein disulfide reductase [Chloroflexi bacterium]|nr:MAG: TlpA family protein disulfide reductase [Chloroflexota bacterium]
MHISRGRLFTVLIGVTLAVVVGTLALALSRGVGSTTGGRSDVRGKALPAFSLARFDGSAFDLKEASGPVFVYFWASWCIPCQEEAPIIQKLWPEYQKRGYTFVGVNIWDAESDGRRFANQHQFTFPIVADADGRVYVDYGVEALPDSFFLEPGLRARSRFQGPLTEPMLRAMLDELGRPGGV